MGFANEKLWRGCKITPIKGGRYNLETERPVAQLNLETNLDQILEEIPEPERDRLIITDAVPDWIKATVIRRFAHFFENLAIFNPHTGETIEISNPPAKKSKPAS